nr:importin-5-like [Tanacetum cinerariifolium]
MRKYAGCNQRVCSVRSIVEELKRVITASSTRRKERDERVKAEDFDVRGRLVIVCALYLRPIRLQFSSF